MYWAVTTIVTVGYGDIIPVTETEKILCIFTMLIANGVFGYSMSNIGTIFGQINKITLEYKLIYKENFFYYVYLCIFMYIYVYLCIFMYIYVYLCIFMYIYVYLCIFMYIYVYLCIFMYIYVYLCIFMYIYVVL